MQEHPRPSPYALIAMGVAYYATARAGLSLAFVHKSATAVWLPTGLSIAAVLLRGPGMWPGIFAGALLANVAVSGNPVESALIAAGNTLEALIGAALVVRFAGGCDAFATARGVLGFTLFGGLCAPAVSATIGVAALWLCGSTELALAPGIWLTWWTGDASGALVAAPLLVLLLRPVEREELAPRPGPVESAALLVAALGVALLVFHGRGAPLHFLLLPVLTWAAFRFSSLTCSLLTVMFVGIAVAATVARRGPFGAHEPHTALLLLQGFMMTVTVVALTGAAAVSELQRLRREARDQARRSEATFSYQPIGLAIISLDGRVREANPAFLEMLGASSEEVRAGTLDLNLLTPEGWAAADSEAARALESGGRCDPYEKELLHRGGARVPVRVGAARLGPSSREAVMFAVDLTDQRRLEERLRQAQKLEAIGQLAGGVAHDFNNLMTVIRGFTDLIEEDGQLRGAQSEEYLREIRSALDRASALIGQLLMFARQRTQPVELLDLDEALGRMTTVLRRVLPASVELKLDLAALRAVVRIDRVQLEQVVLNVALNARDAMPSGGHFTIRTRAPDPAPADAACVVMELVDDGQGMPDDVRLRAFDPFFTTKPVGRGTGLGLSTVYGIVQQAGGGASLDSGSGRGTTLRIELPRAAGATATRALPEAGEPQGTETVLLVDDETSVRRVVASLLGQLGYRVIAAGDAEEAERLFQSFKGEIDLVISDVVMPGVRGPELVRRLRAQQPGLKVILISGHHQPSDASDEIPEGVRFLAKPFDRAMIARALRAVLDAA